MPERPLSERFEQWWNSHPNWASPATGDPSPYNWALAGAEWLEAENARLRSLNHEQRHQAPGVSRWIQVGEEHGYWSHPMTTRKMSDRANRELGSENLRLEAENARLRRERRAAVLRVYDAAVFLVKENVNPGGTWDFTDYRHNGEFDHNMDDLLAAVREAEPDA